MDVSQLKRLAGDRSFTRGEAYFEEGRVRSLAERKGVLTGIVKGQNDYRVTLGCEDDEIEYSCTCPVGLDGEFCKHLVALALAWISPESDRAGKVSGNKKRETTEDKTQSVPRLAGQGSFDSDAPRRICREPQSARATVA
jgi:uncharacterized Zn finger protein